MKTILLTIGSNNWKGYLADNLLDWILGSYIVDLNHKALLFLFPKPTKVYFHNFLGKEDLWIAFFDNSFKIFHLQKLPRNTKSPSFYVKGAIEWSHPPKGVLNNFVKYILL